MKSTKEVNLRGETHCRRLEAAARAARQILVERWGHARAERAPEALRAVALLTAELEDTEVEEV